jgi:hypothetical protein
MTTRKPVARKTPKKTPATRSATRRPAAKAPAKTAAARKAAPKPVANPQAAVPEAKPHKPKLVRDSFTMPKLEYVVIDALKQRGAKLGKPIKKSELLRAGVKLLAMLGDSEFVVALEAVPAIKTGRPKSKKTTEPASTD